MWVAQGLLVVQPLPLQFPFHDFIDADDEMGWGTWSDLAPQIVLAPQCFGESTVKALGSACAFILPHPPPRLWSASCLAHLCMVTRLFPKEPRLKPMPLTMPRVHGEAFRVMQLSTVLFSASL